MSRNLYQLTSRIKDLPAGRSFDIDGPYDRYGHVVKRLEERETESLYLVRGTGSNPKEQSS